MSLKDAICTVRDAALSRLVDAHDYFEFTAEAWRVLQFQVDFRELVFTFRNPLTGTSASQTSVIARSQGYVARELAEATLQQFVSIFEAFLGDVLRIWLVAHPASLSKRQLTGEDILALPDKAAIVDALATKELASVLYDRPANWFRFLNDRVNLGVPTDAEIRQFTEVKATRDILVHGLGIANTQYVDKSGTMARAAIGQVLDVPLPYHRASWELLRQLTDNIGTAMAAKA